jgi:hypothetical protein
VGGNRNYRNTIKSKNAITALLSFKKNYMKKAEKETADKR